MQNCKLIHIEISRVHDLKLQPIVAWPSCQTHRLSDIIDMLLKPYAIHVNSYLRNRVDFLNAFLNERRNTACIVRFRVIILYINIPRELRIEAITYCLDIVKMLFWREKNLYLKIIHFTLIDHSRQIRKQNLPLYMPHY